MEAVFLTPQGLLETSTATPQLKKGELMIQVEQCTLFHEDLNAWQPQTIPGRGIVGHVCGTGEGLSKSTWMGHRVAIIPFLRCRCCVPCRTGREHLCKKLQTLGGLYGPNAVSALPGGAAEYVCAKPEQTLLVNEDVDSQVISTLPVYALALRAAQSAPLLAAEDVLIYGNGSTGLALTEILQVLGAAHVTYVDVDPQQRELARKQGADHCFSPDELPSLRFRAVFDTAVLPETQRFCLNLLAEKGQLINIGGAEGAVPYILRDFNGERSLRRVDGATYKSFYDALRLMHAGRIKALGLLGPMLSAKECSCAEQMLRQGMASTTLAF